MNHGHILQVGSVLAFLFLFASCSDGEDASDFYPNITTMFATIKSDGAGRLSELVIDDGNIYTISNPQDGYKRDTCYRAVCGFVAEGQCATLYHATGAYLLGDSTELTYEPDAINVVSAWLSGRYINMQLSPFTGGGTQYWGFRYDKTTEHTTHISLHHRQNGDPLSYTQTVYASLHVDSLKAIPPDDTIALHIRTFKGESTWTFKKSPKV